MKNLIKKFKNQSINSEELALLLKAFKGEDISGEVQEVFSDFWDASSSNNDELDSDIEWNAIVQKIDQDNERINTVHFEPIRVNTRMWNLLKYAAIFILAFGLSWLLHGIISNESLLPNTQYSKVEVSNGSKSKIELPDGTLVNLNSGSFIRYPNNFEGKTREVYIEGEAYFNVKKDRNKPFIVKTSEIQIKVLGTQFNVKAYPDEKEIETTLILGKVEVFYESGGSLGNKRVIMLKPNDKLVIQKSFSKLTKTQNESSVALKQITPEKPVKLEYVPNPSLYTSWKDDKLKFNNVRFEDLISKFERWYNVTIEIQSAEIKSARLSGEFEKETVEQALKALNLTVPFQYEMDKNKIIIYPKNKQ